jgi:ParB family chromosome partitioning protein
VGDGPALEEIPVDAIEPNPNQPRVHFDEASLADLAASIREIGVLQPILVRPAEHGRYQLIAGERRWRAARRAELQLIPAIVRQVDQLASVEQALVENLHRADLTALEEASAYQQLIEDFAFTHEQLASRVGKSRAAVTNTLRLLSLPPAIQHLLADGQLSAGHARALLGTADRSYQEQLARRAASEGWSVRTVEQAIRDRETRTVAVSTGATPASSGTPTPKLRSAAVLELEGRLGDYLETNVGIKLGKGRGRVTIDFADLDDLDRIFRKMTQVEEPS